MNPWALFLGWAAGMSWGTWMASQLKLASSIYPLQIFGTTIPVYAALSSLLLNIAIVVVLTLALGTKDRRDETVEGDYV
jgi:SSS family solute:Na+ symporter